ncbi:hypothetical protein DAEQUDRAFT_20019 [Daedalea quercina L-15889]|uniref:Uncharacterized protein n=1 Tax=Daedalea quercina L-15889 TaxID=1314783 RepID=A0A165UKT3_9APHY|nr:hypothetical protein DAEQUDRAFT_20019 [Daedalea quercina L-15889]
MDNSSARHANLGSGSQLNVLSASSAFSSAPGSNRTTNAPQSSFIARVHTPSTDARLHHYVYRRGDKLYSAALPIAPTSVCPRKTETLRIAPRASYTAPSGQSSSSARGGSPVASVTNRMAPSSHPAQRQDVSTPAGLSSSMHAPPHKRHAFDSADGTRSSSDPSPRAVTPSTSSAALFHLGSTQGSSRGLEGSIWARGAEQPQPRLVKKTPSGSKRGAGRSRPGVAGQFVFGALPGRVNNVGGGQHLSMKAQR